MVNAILQEPTLFYRWTPFSKQTSWHLMFSSRWSDSLSLFIWTWRIEQKKLNNIPIHHYFIAQISTSTSSQLPKQSIEQWFNWPKYHFIKSSRPNWTWTPSTIWLPLLPSPQTGLNETPFFICGHTFEPVLGASLCFGSFSSGFGIWSTRLPLLEVLCCCCSCWYSASSFDVYY